MDWGVSDGVSRNHDIANQKKANPVFVNTPDLETGVETYKHILGMYNNLFSGASTGSG